MNLFVDTSALIKLYHQEVGSDNFTDLLDRWADDLIITIADITKIEFHSVFLRRFRSKEIALARVKKVFEAIDKDAQMFSLVEVDDVVKNFAIQLLDITAHQASMRTLDAIQLSSAIVSHQIVPIDYFVASDKNLLNVAKHYFHTFNPELETV